MIKKLSSFKKKKNGDLYSSQKLIDQARISLKSYFYRSYKILTLLRQKKEVDLVCANQKIRASLLNFRAAFIPIKDNKEKFKDEIIAFEKIWENYSWIIKSLSEKINQEMKIAQRDVHELMKSREQIQPYFSNKSRISRFEIKA